MVCTIAVTREREAGADSHDVGVTDVWLLLFSWSSTCVDVAGSLAVPEWPQQKVALAVAVVSMKIVTAGCMMLLCVVTGSAASAHSGASRAAATKEKKDH